MVPPRRPACETSWARLLIPGRELKEARLHSHHAAQVNTRLARGFVAARADDSHTSLEWHAATGAIVGQAVSQFRIGLRISDLTLIMLDRSATLTAVFPLDGRSFDQALQWLGDRLVQRGLDPAPLSRPLHFALDDDPLLDGATFRLRGREKAFEELGRWYSNAALCLASVASPVRCWPHHFDIAVQILAGERSIGVGMSPGDVSYGQPYFYVTPWPYPAAADLPPLRLGNWHTNGWTGAVLTADEILASADQQQLVEEFLAGAIGVLR